MYINRDYLKQQIHLIREGSFKIIFREVSKSDLKTTGALNFRARILSSTKINIAYEIRKVQIREFLVSLCFLKHAVEMLPRNMQWNAFSKYVVNIPLKWKAPPREVPWGCVV